MLTLVFRPDHLSLLAGPLDYSSIYTELLYVSPSWLVNIDVSMGKCSFNNIAFDFVLTS